MFSLVDHYRRLANEAGERAAASNGPVPEINVRRAGQGVCTVGAG
jgi:hypothetical protein